MTDNKEWPKPPETEWEQWLANRMCQLLGHRMKKISHYDSSDQLICTRCYNWAQSI